MKHSNRFMSFALASAVAAAAASTPSLVWLGTGMGSSGGSMGFGTVPVIGI